MPEAPLAALAAVAIAAVASGADGLAPVRLGVLQHVDAHTEEILAAGVRGTVLGLAWGAAEPKQGQFSSEYFALLRARAEAWRAAGLELVLDLGIQYPPVWAEELPCGRMVNQFGEEYIDVRPGFRRANAVFSPAVRENLECYLDAVKRELGDDFTAIRLGFGHYGELNYPAARHNGRENCYWTFDEAAQGRAPLPPGMSPCPVPGYIPGTPGREKDAAAFLEWHLESLRLWHDWQIEVVRARFPNATLAMLYPSWGMRPGQAEAAVAAGLDGSTSPERNGEVPRGLDFARCIAGVHDTNFVVCCTWVDSNLEFGDDRGLPQRWSPVHWLAHLANEHQPPLPVWGENTGGGGMAALSLTVERARENGLQWVFWAFEPALFSGEPPALADLTKAFGIGLE